MLEDSAPLVVHNKDSAWQQLAVAAEMTDHDIAILAAV
jgi:hypothetical protein